MEKVCIKCKTKQDILNFDKGGYDKSKFKNICKKCISLYNKEYWKKYSVKNAEKLRKHHLEQDKERYKDPEYRSKRREYGRNYYYRHKEELNSGRLRTRFEVFKRDNFTCQYCGRKAPKVILEIDHKTPKSKGGKNELGNYITACSDCNNGKSDILLNNLNINS